MAIAGSIEMQINLPGMKKTAKFDRTAAGSVPAVDAALSAAAAGTLSARGGDTEGTLTLGAGHGITDGDVIAIFWTGGSCYLGTVGTVSGTSVPFSGTLGDVLPAQDTAVTADVMENYDVDFDGDKAEIVVAMFTTGRGLAVFEDSVGASAAAIQYAADIAAGEAFLFIADANLTNELEGNAVDEVWIANGDSSAANAFAMSGLYNSDT